MSSSTVEMSRAPFSKVDEDMSCATTFSSSSTPNTAYCVGFDAGSVGSRNPLSLYHRAVAAAGRAAAFRVGSSARTVAAGA